QPEEEGRVLEQAEQRPAVMRVDHADEVIDHRQALSLGRDQRYEYGLRELIDDEDGGGQRKEQRPARTVTPRRPAHAARRRAIVTVSPPSRVTLDRVAPDGMSPDMSVARVSAATDGRWAATSGGAPTTHSSIRSSSSRPASRRRSCTARAISRASPSARSSGVSAV